MKTPIVLLLLNCFFGGIVSDFYGGLYPRESESREVKSLDGIWDFRLAPRDDPDLGFTEMWFEKPLRLVGYTIPMAVPCSYNDVTQSRDLRDHIGWAWYSRNFYVSKSWVDGSHRIVVRVGSAHYNSILYINGQNVATHEVGHLPFSADITDLVFANQSNWITICLNNTLTPLTIPQGNVVYPDDDASRYPPGYFTLDYDFDFFNYAGIHRPVVLYTTPVTYIEDITITTNISATTGVVGYDIKIQSPDTASNSCKVEIFDKQNVLVAMDSECNGEISIQNATFWWPYLMADDPGYMYTMKINVSDSLGNSDIYRQKFGIRTISWNSTTVSLNNSPLYLRGCGKHEDADIIGKGLSYPLIVKDFSLLKWLGANSFRTSHYPYAEEIMDMADEEGIMIIDESPAVNLVDFGEELLTKHKTVMEAMYHRDKNRPSVIMWSVANEPRSNTDLADVYFMNLTGYVRSLDPSRPVTAALAQSVGGEKAADAMDVLLINRYFSWYSDTGHLELIQAQTDAEFHDWYITYDKPLMISEYGADTLPGLHMDPSFVWSEEYQAELLAENFKAFDRLKQDGFFFGEMIWNFADFATQQGTNRAGGNRKGIFTRQRQPKLAAHLLRERYHQLANKNVDTNIRLIYVYD